MSNAITRNLNRAERRKMNKRDIDAVKDNTQDELAALLLSVWVDVIWDDVEEEAVVDWVDRVVKRYNEIENFTEFRNQVYLKTGMGIFRDNTIPKELKTKKEEANNADGSNIHIGNGAGDSDSVVSN